MVRFKGFPEPANTWKGFRIRAGVGRLMQVTPQPFNFPKCPSQLAADSAKHRVKPHGFPGGPGKIPRIASLGQRHQVFPEFLQFLVVQTPRQGHFAVGPVLLGHPVV